MKPNTLHFVVTLENSINIGFHFFCLANLMDHICGVVHTGIAELIVTNTVHPELPPVMRRLLDKAFQDYLDIAQGKCSIDGQ
jgi:hypothetical protein